MTSSALNEGNELFHFPSSLSTVINLYFFPEKYFCIIFVVVKCNIMELCAFIVCHLVVVNEAMMNSLTLHAPIGQCNTYITSFNSTRARFDHVVSEMLKVCVCCHWMCFVSSIKNITS